MYNPAGMRLHATLAVLLLVAACGHHDARPGATATHGGPTPPPPVDTMREGILAGLALRPGMTVAELGLGRGWFVFRAAEAVGRTGHVYATDIDPDAIRFMREQLPHINPASSPVDVRLCRDGHDTGLDDLPADTFDVMLMIDALCFDGQSPHADDVAYLHRFQRLLRPGGRFVHHMDCNCGAAPAAVTALFVEAGFTPRAGTIELPVAPTPPPNWGCRTAEARARDHFVGVYGKAEP